MSQIRYSIFVIFMFVFIQLSSQERIEGDNALLKNSIEVKIKNSELDFNKGDYQSSIFNLNNASSNLQFIQ